jgi:tetratricopeptide (TPR) repeat protein
MPEPMATTPLALLLRAIDRALDPLSGSEGARREAHDVAHAEVLRLVAQAEEAASDAAPAQTAFVHVASAQLRFAVGDRTGAHAALERALAIDPARAGVVLAHRALFLRKEGRLAAALAVLDEVSSHAGHAASAHALAAEIRAAARDDEGALAQFDRAIAAGASSAGLWMAKAEILSRCERIDEARRAVAAALAAEPGSSALALEAGARWMELGAFEDAERAFVAASRDTHLSPTATAHRARLRLWWGEREAAAALADEALAADPGLALGLCVRGAIEVLRGDPEAATATLDRALARDETLYEAFLWRAEAHGRRGDRAQAIDDLERATWRWGDYFAAHALRLLLAIRAAPRGARTSPYAVESVRAGVTALLDGDADGRVGEALDSPELHVIAPLLERALEALGGNRSPTLTTVREEAGVRRLVRLPTPVTARFAAKWTQERIQVVPLAEVLDRFEVVLREHAYSSKPYCYRGELRLWVGDLVAAREDFERALAADPATKWAYIGLCAVEMLEGHHAEALAVSARGIARTGEGPSIFVYRGETHRRAGALDAAAVDLERACQLNPSRVGAWVNLALLQGARGDRDGQRATMDRLRWQAPSLLADAASASPAPRDDDALLDRCLAMMRGNRSSTCVTYFVGEELRVVPFVARPEGDGADRTLAALRASLLRRAKR